ncbi:hypothetical protein HII31_07957 [Pseudocercospora fuligena]|uniref:Uncharacterized protein n=1 Tax=Pseudocercospora fuligena TaxID=685502 RepID=A0A8H6VFV4_9PEZI|nr:hypothetical protein HII31_07957 [Pseudocercospora fuligena]
MRLFKNPPPPPTAEMFTYEELPAELVAMIMDINMNRSRTNSIPGQPGLLLVCKEWYELQKNRFHRHTQAYIKIKVKAHRRDGQLILNAYKLKGDTILKTSRPTSEQIRDAVKRFENASILSIRMIVDCCEHWVTKSDCQCYDDTDCLKGNADPMGLYRVIFPALPKLMRCRMHWENYAVGFDPIHYIFCRASTQHSWTEEPQEIRGRREDICSACKFTKQNPNVDSDQSGSSGSSNSHQGSDSP